MNVDIFKRSQSCRESSRTYGWKLDEVMCYIEWCEGDASSCVLNVLWEYKEGQKHNGGDIGTDDGMLEQLFWAYLSG